MLPQGHPLKSQKRLYFVIFSLCCLLVLAVVVHRMMLKRSVPYMIVLFLLFAATMGTVSYSGNTEFIFVPLQMLAITLALDSRKRPAFFLLSAATAVAATNVNPHSPDDTLISGRLSTIKV